MSCFAQKVFVSFFKL